MPHEFRATTNLVSPRFLPRPGGLKVVKVVVNTGGVDIKDGTELEDEYFLDDTVTVSGNTMSGRIYQGVATERSDVLISENCIASSMNAGAEAPRRNVTTPWTAAGSPPVSAPPSAPVSGGYWLQAGSFRQHEDADRRRAQLALLGFTSVIQRVAVDDQTWHRVRVGRYRILYSIEDDRLIVTVVKVGDRKDVYRRRPK